MDLRATLGLFTNMWKKCFAIFEAAEVAGMPDEETSCFLEPLEAFVCCLLCCCPYGVRVWTGKESEGAQVLGRGTKDRPQV
jgi:hypothetical protein